MLPDFGWSELLIIGIVLIVVIGPKDLPRVMKGFSKSLKSARKMSDDFRKQFSDALDDAELTEMRDLAIDMKSLDPRTQIKDALAPLGKLGADMTGEIKKVTEELDTPAVQRIPSAAEQALAASGDKAKAAQPKAKAKVATKVDVDSDSKSVPESKDAPSANMVADIAEKTAKKPASKKTVAKKAAAPKKSATRKAPVKKAAAKKPASQADDVT